MEVAYFTQKDFLSAGSPWDKDPVGVFHTVEELLSSHEDPGAVVIGVKDDTLAASLVRKLRSNQLFSSTPIFLEHKTKGEASSLVDGFAQSLRVVLSQCRLIA